MIENLRVLFFLVPLIVFWNSAYGQNEAPWVIVRQEEGITVYTRENTVTDLKEVRIGLNVRAQLDELIDFLADALLYTRWVYKCSHSERIMTVSDQEFYYYIVSDFPFPFSDRDLVVHSRQWIEPSTGAYHSHSIASPGLLPLKEDLIRITHFRSAWIITPIGDGLVSIDYEAVSSPAGDIPIWLVNLAIAKGPFETMLKFKQLVEIGDDLRIENVGIGN